jgi:hypothetical protein
LKDQLHVVYSLNAANFMEATVFLSVLIANGVFSVLLRQIMGFEIISLNTSPKTSIFNGKILITGQAADGVVRDVKI